MQLTKKTRMPLLLAFASLCLAALFALTGVHTAYAATEDGVEFYRWNSSSQRLEEASQNGVLIAEDGLCEIGEGHASWVVVNKKVETETLKVYGDANIILAAGGELTVGEIYGVSASSTLHIFGTASDGSGGTLRVIYELMAPVSCNLDIQGGSTTVESESEEWIGDGTYGVLGDVSVCAGVLSIRTGAYGIIGNLTMAGGDVKIKAGFVGVSGDVSVSGGKLDILAGTRGIDGGALTCAKGLESVHVAVNTPELGSAIKGEGYPRVFSVFNISEDDFTFWESYVVSRGHWNEYPLGGITEFDGYNMAEALILPKGEKPSFDPVHNDAVSSFRLSFDANGGNGFGAGMLVDEPYIVAEQPDCRFFAPDGMEFAGWSLTPDGESVAFPMTLSGDTVLFALWRETGSEPAPAPADDGAAGSGSNGSEMPATGDASGMAALALGALSSMAAIASMLAARKRKKG